MASIKRAGLDTIFHAEKRERSLRKTGPATVILEGQKGCGAKFKDV